jgi:zinc transport system substrate-binding protein
MRRSRGAAVAVAVFLLFTAPAAVSAATLHVLASFLPMYLFTVNVVGDAPDVSVKMMLPPSVGPHDYALTPGDMRKIASADLFIANGLGMEEFLGPPVRKVNPHLRVVETAASVTPLTERRTERDPVETNPHAWVSPKNAILQVRAIERALIAASPGNEARFRAHADAYIKRLRALDREYEEASRTFRHRNIVTYHNAFGYLARDYGLSIVGEVETAPGQEPSAGEIQALVRTIRKKEVPALFAEPQYPVRTAETIAREAGIPTRVLDPVATGSTAPTTYETVMRRNLAVLEEALTGR